MVTAISAAKQHTRAADKAIHWYRNELIADYRHRTAAELVADREVETASTFLQNLESGARW